MSVDSDGSKDLSKLNHQLHSGNRRVEDGVVSEEHNLVEGDGLKVNGIKDGHGGASQAPAVALQISQQQQSQGAVVCWERFLHLRSIKVLLVENDDSTRHVVTALLRNCSYEVIEAANGLQAWKILEDLTNHIDLVLTAVVMPCFSGIGLLCKIMSHKTRKNVPVIMMSSHDSMGLVFKCLSKGAVDFLVKPIRKNELKNIWQHLWRRCHSSSGSGSESSTQTQKSVKSESVGKSDNNTGSNDEDDTESISLSVAGDGSDNGSGTQSSWTKQAVEVDSPRPMSPWDQVAECPDSTCAQVIHPNAEISGNKQAPGTTVRVRERKEEQLDNAIGKEQEKVVPENLNLQLGYQAEDPIKLVGAKQKNLLERGSGKFKEQIDKAQLDLNSESPSNQLKYEAVNLIGFPTNTADPLTDSTEFEASKHSMILDVKNKTPADAKETPPLELCLKRLRGVQDIRTAVVEDRNVLRRSDSSAFSRYNSASNANKASSANIRSRSPHDCSLDITNKGSVCHLQSHFHSDHPNQCSNAGSDNIDMGSNTNNTFTESAVLKNKSAGSSTVKYHQPGVQPVKGDPLCSTQQILSEKADNIASKMMLSQPRGTNQELQIQHLTDQCDHHHLLHNMQPQQQLPPSNQDESSLKKMAEAVLHCGPSNMLDGPVEGNGGNYSINGSASGSNHGSNQGSNGQNGSSTAVNAGGTNVESDNGIAGKTGSRDGSGSGSRDGNRTDESKFSQREAVLTKFRQKRKERCFRKKVRYQSRKRLAEQRLCVRGKFVRQTANESTSGLAGHKLAP